MTQPSSRVPVATWLTVTIKSDYFQIKPLQKLIFPTRIDERERHIYSIHVCQFASMLRCRSDVCIFSFSFSGILFLRVCDITCVNDL